MPFKYKIIHEKKIAFVQAVGRIDLHSSIKTMLMVVSNKEYNPDYKAIIDLSKVDYDFSMMEVFSLRDTIISLKHKVNDEIIVIAKNKLLSRINMISFLAKVYNIKMKAVDHYEGLDELESSL